MFATVEFQFLPLVDGSVRPTLVLLDEEARDYRVYEDNKEEWECGKWSGETG